MQLRRKKVEEVEAQITAMIDMTFLLLIFFMATAKFVFPEGTIPAFGMTESQGEGGGGVPAFGLHIVKNVDGRTLVVMDDGYTTDINALDEIRNRLRVYYRTNVLLNAPKTAEGEPALAEGTEVTVQCADDVRWEAVVRILDIVREEKIPNIRFKEQS